MMTDFHPQPGPQVRVIRHFGPGHRHSGVWTCLQETLPKGLGSLVAPPARSPRCLSSNRASFLADSEPPALALCLGHPPPPQAFLGKERRLWSQDWLGGLAAPSGQAERNCPGWAGREKLPWQGSAFHLYYWPTSMGPGSEGIGEPSGAARPTRAWGRAPLLPRSSGQGVLLRSRGSGIGPTVRVDRR